MASLLTRTKWKMLSFLFRHHKHILLLVVVGVALGLVIVISMEPPIPYMNRVDLGPAKQRELIDEMVRERERKQEVVRERERKLELEWLELQEEKKRKRERKDSKPVYKMREEERKLALDDPQYDEHDDDDVFDNKDENSWLNIKQKDQMKQRFVPYKNTIMPIKNSPFNGGKGQCSVINTKLEQEGEFECMKLKIKKPLTPICIHPDSDDIHVSRHIREEGLWEPHMLMQFQYMLYGDPALGVIDIGANIGEYTLVAAAMNHTVVAVEPFTSNLRLLTKAIQIGNLHDRVTVVKNAISDDHRHLFLETPKDNQGGVSLRDRDADPWCEESECGPQAKTIFMDDLLEVTNFERALIKIDIEGHEHRAFRHSKELLKQIWVPFIMMEWIKLRSYYGSEVTESEDKDLTHDLVNFLHAQGYKAYSFITGVKLTKHMWYAWPDDILWKHDLADVD